MRGNVMENKEVVSLKCTGEYVIILSTNPEEFNQFGPIDDSQYGTVLVRRAKLTRDGIVYTLCLFFEYELETVQDHIKREVTEALLKIQAQKDIMQAKMKALEADEPETKIDFGIN